MEDFKHRRLLTIGEFAAATQLTAKALRLYDEQGLLRPAATDAASGYRYYESSQVATGRFIRALRDMSLSLVQIGRVLDAPLGLRLALLRDCLAEAEQRLARERKAYQSAILMMRRSPASAAAGIEQHRAPAQRLAVFELVTNRRAFIDSVMLQRASILQRLSALDLQPAASIVCSLIEPLSDEDARAELLVAIDDANDTALRGLTTRHLPPRHYAAIAAPPAARADGFTACIDALFDWFDRRGLHAIGCPEVALDPIDTSLNATVRWAFEPDPN